MNSMIELQARVPGELSLNRLDQAAAILFPEYSRSRLQAWIKSGELKVDGRTCKPRDKVNQGEIISVEAAPEILNENEPQEIPLEFVYEDEAILVVNKPSGLVVHPGAGNHTGTLLNALLFRCPELAGVPRAGIVHRLDKDTTGLMVVARTIGSQNHLVQQMQAREVQRIYQALLFGVIPVSGVVDEPVGRHPRNRLKMSISKQGKEAVTNYRRLQQFEGLSLARFSLVTGRTHQIRVHMQHLGYPLVGDQTYGGRFRKHAGWSSELIAALQQFSRQALHARKLSFRHPISEELMTFSADIPEDMRDLLAAVEAQA